MSFAIYIIGILILIGGLFYVGHLVHMPQAWMIGLSILIFGAGLVGAVSTTRQKDPN